MINARVDTFMHGSGTPEERIAESVRRGKAYLEAGADCVYPLAADGLDLAEARALVDEIGVPVNVAYLPGGPSLTELGKAGIGD